MASIIAKPWYSNDVYHEDTYLKPRNRTGYYGWQTGWSKQSRFLQRAAEDKAEQAKEKKEGK
jgi:hypothetical protein